MSTIPSLAALEAQVKERPLPGHVGIIMDGNGRWAEERGLSRLEGHREGSNSVREVTRAARRMGIQALTLYAFSSQNWSRPIEEVAGLMDLLQEYLDKERREILENGIRLNAVGELDRLPRMVRNPLEALRTESAGNSSMVLTLALSYGGQEEIVAAASRLLSAARTGKLPDRPLTPEAFADYLWTAPLPPVDLVIRTSGEHRVSNFLLWQSAYAEYIFTDTLWPEFRAHHFLACVAEYQHRERRFGLTSAQLPK
ncbi:MAG TPA: polyprenyl diphosphate synthase [Myxococcaceae bacterium]|nr:polyprenyl diphosphate synthase [Myxococcaceae bacterium]